MSSTHTGKRFPDGRLVPERVHKRKRTAKQRRLKAIIKSLPDPAYSTRTGHAFHGESLALLSRIPTKSIDLVITSPPFPLLRKKSYGNASAETYLDWFAPYAQEIFRVLRKRGSFVLELGGTWERGKPVRSLYQYAVLLELSKTFFLAQDFYYFNTAKLPTPAEYVNIRRIRLKDAVNTVWWLSKTEHPKADNSRVLYPYGERMEMLLRNGYNSGDRPSQHRISKKWQKRNRGSISPNLLACPNTMSTDPYLRRCKNHRILAHPARFTPALPTFFLRFLTEPGDVILDPFSGSNTSGQVAEELERHWIAFEQDAGYIAGSSLRFFETPVVIAPLNRSPQRSRKRSASIPASHR